MKRRDGEEAIVARTKEFEHFAQVARYLRVLAHPHRLQLCELLRKEPRSVSELARELGLRPNTVSQHLSHLRAHSLVSYRREGRIVYYYLIHPQTGWLLECIHKHSRH